MKPEILVLGASGNVGFEAARALIARRMAIRVGGSSPERLRNRLDGQAEAVRFDFADPGCYEAAFIGIKKLFLMRPPHISDVRRLMYPAMDAAKAAGVRQVVFLSLIGIEENKQVPHHKVEEYLLASGQDYTFLRCGFFMQNLDTTHRDEIRGRDELYIPAGRAKTAFIDARDIGAVAALALTEPGHEGKAYDLTGSEALDYYQVAELLTKALGRTITYANPSGLAFFLRQLKRGQALAFALVTTWLYANTRKGMAAEVTGELRRLLGREPISMERYIEDYKSAWQSG